VIVDTHVHVVAADRARYPLRPAAVDLDWFREAPVTVEDFLELMSTAGVDRAVLVQPMSAYGFDNRYVIDSARMHSEWLTSVVIIDTVDHPARRLRAMAREGVSGVRLFAIGNPTLDRLDDSNAFGVCAVERSSASAWSSPFSPSSFPGCASCSSASRR
jgi:L-fuconolactonase